MKRAIIPGTPVSKSENNSAVLNRPEAGPVGNEIWRRIGSAIENVYEIKYLRY